MKKILIAIKKDALIFTFNYKLDIDTKKLLNTNIISDNQLVFSDEYIQTNAKIVGTFINELIDNKTINKIVITNLDILYILSNALEYICKVDTLFISDENNFTYQAYEIITKVNKFNKINCYSIPTYMIDLFDKKNIEVESRAEILYTSNFMEDNNLISYSKMYYKTSIKVSPPLTEDDLNDFRSFCKINKYLKKVNFDAYSLNALDDIAKIILETRKKNITIIVHDNITDKEMIDKLKKKKKLFKKKGITLSLKYTQDYINKNFFKQLITSTLIICAFAIILISSGSIVYILLNNMESERNVEDISKRIEEKIATDNFSEEELTNDDKFNEENPIKVKKMIPKMKSLLEMNNETVGWLTVPGTNIDYPVVKARNNDFYLNHNFDKKKDYNGWVYLNSENNSTDLDQNTIIYAHNRFYSGVMFGTLNNLTKEKWYKEASNISIFYNTLYDELEAEVFSIYTVKVTDDYLTTNFNSDEEFLNFINMLKERSIFQSSASIDKDDKIITLSTCVENDARLVVHAVLKK